MANKVPFRYYLHDDYNSSERKDFIQEQTEVSDEVIDNIGRPFYKVTLYCEIDTETGEVTLVRAEL